MRKYQIIYADPPWKYNVASSKGTSRGVAERYYKVMKLEDIKALKVKDLDAIKDTPIIDIKPYVPRADRKFKVKTPKWLHHGPKT